MNISEVSMLSRNLWWFYQGFSDPYLYTLIGGHMWNLDKDKMTERSYSLTPQQLSERVFDWVEE